MRYAVELHERILRVSDTESGHTRASKNKGRGNISGISSKSRYRLIKLLAKINRPDEPVFITLTYREYTENFTDWKADLHRFICSFRYHYAGLAGVWRLEFQQRGAPHFHVLLWLGQESPFEQLEKTVSGCWLNAIGQHTKANQEWGAKVERCSDFRKTAFYLSVYQAKDSQDRTDIRTGREWGVWGREKLGLAAIECVKLSAAGLLLFRRVVRRSYISHQRRTGKIVGRFAGSLRQNLCFSAFLPYAAARRLAVWAEANAEEILTRNVERANAESVLSHELL